MASKHDLTNMRFGRLIAQYRTDDYVSPKGYRQKMWHCVCDCGNECNVRESRLINGVTRSCGCLHRENVIEFNHTKAKNNNYDLTGEYGIGWTSNNQIFYFDIEDYELIKNYSWYIDKHGYVRGYVRGSHQKIINMHNIILPPKDNYYVDHIYGKRNDNRKSQLRYLSMNDNVLNHVVGKNNTSGVSGVSFHKGCKSWIAQLCYHNEHFYLGSFKTFEEAVEARVRAEWELLSHDVAPNRDKFQNYNLEEGDAHNA